jgi:hypothetical protein
MKLSIEHINPSAGSLPSQKIGYLELAERLDPKLMRFLMKELSMGNSIYEVREDYPEKGSICVSLSNPFTEAHTLPEGVRYVEDSDPHYNEAMYLTDSLSPHALTAPVKNSF